MNVSMQKIHDNAEMAQQLFKQRPDHMVGLGPGANVDSMSLSTPAGVPK
jgi:hypothetical protein